MSEYNKGKFIYECPYCGEKCIPLWQKHYALYAGNDCKCEKCGAILKYKTKVYYINALVTILIVILYFYIQSKRESGSFSLFMANFIIIVQAAFYFIYMWFEKLTYLPDGKHPERIFKREIQTLYGGLSVFVEESVFYEKDYIVRLKGMGKEEQFLISKATFNALNPTDLVRNSTNESVFRVFNHYVLIKADCMVLQDTL